jgi:hypothetical protein
MVSATGWDREIRDRASVSAAQRMALVVGRDELAGGPAKGVGDPLSKGERLRHDHPAVTGGIGSAALSPVLVSLLGCREHGDV